MDTSYIEENAKDALQEFTDTHQDFDQIMRHPVSTTAAKLAFSACMNDRVVALQQMQLIVKNHDDLDWRRIVSDFNDNLGTGGDLNSGLL